MEILISVVTTSFLLNLLIPSTMACVNTIFTCARRLVTALGENASNQYPCRLVRNFFDCVEFGCNQTMPSCDLLKSKFDLYTYFQCDYNITLATVCNSSGSTHTHNVFLPVAIATLSVLFFLRSRRWTLFS